MKNLKTAVIGVGRLGKEHARIYNILPNVDLIGVVDIDGKRSSEIAKRNKTEVVSIDQAISEADAVSIAVPTDLHFGIAEKLMNAGRHVLIEKPITDTVENAEQLVNIARQNGVILQVGHVERFNPVIEALTDIVKKPKFIEIHRLSPFTPRGTEVGVVLDLMIHDIDILLDLVKGEIDRIDAVGVDVLTSYEDIANARIKFRDGCVANITASRISADRMRKIRIFQKDAYISLNYFSQKGRYYFKKNNRILHKKMKIRKSEPLRKELESFVHCVLTGETPLVSGEDALKSLQVSKQITQQIWSEIKIQNAV